MSGPEISTSCPVCGRWELVIRASSQDRPVELLTQRCACFLTDNDIEAALACYWSEAEEGAAYRRHPEL